MYVVRSLAASSKSETTDGQENQVLSFQVKVGLKAPKTFVLHMQHHE